MLSENFHCSLCPLFNSSIPTSVLSLKFYDGSQQLMNVVKTFGGRFLVSSTIQTWDINHLTQVASALAA